MPSTRPGTWFRIGHSEKLISGGTALPRNSKAREDSAVRSQGTSPCLSEVRVFTPGGVRNHQDCYSNWHQESQEGYCFVFCILFLIQVEEKSKHSESMPAFLQQVLRGLSLFRWPCRVEGISMHDLLPPQRAANSRGVQGCLPGAATSSHAFWVAVLCQAAANTDSLRWALT